jgi:hypothetical protein
MPRHILGRGGGSYERGTLVNPKLNKQASKGRKLRHDVQPKLVNFMFPEVVTRPAFTDSLIENVFKAS